MGKRFKTFIVLAIALLFMAPLVGPVIADQSKVVLVGGGQAYKPLDDFLLEGEIVGGVAGDSWYVDSGKSASGDGKSWDYAVITWDEAINLATASNGDVIHVAPGHEETINSATVVIFDVSGVTSIGYGEGRCRPTFAWATLSAATLPISVADVVFKNMIFDGSSTAADGPDAMFTVTAAGFQLIGCEIILADATEAATLGISGTSDADRMKVIGNRFYGSSDETGCAAAISFATTVVADDIEIAYNTFEADFSSAAIYAASAITQVNIHHNYIFNYQDDDHAIEFVSDALGTIAYNQLVTDAYLTAIDAGACDVFETYWANDEVADTMGTQVLVNENGYAPWGAIQLAAMQKEANDALVEEDLDHLLIFTAGALAYPTNVLDDSIIGHIMATDLISSYVRTTDSLEALGTQVADSNLELQANDALVEEELDHLVALADGSAAYPGSVLDDSIMGFILATNYVSTYVRTTDSLEALGTDTDALIVSVALIPQSTGSVTWNTTALASIEAEAIDAIESFTLDELMFLTVTTDLGTAVHDTSTLGYVLATQYVSTYNRATDSLQALGTNLAAGTGAILALESFTLDEFMKETVTTDMDTAVHNGSALGYLMVTSVMSTYNRATDSLEAIGTDTDLIIVDTTAIEADTIAIELDTKDLQARAEQCVTYAAAALPATTQTAIFTVGTGPVEILGFVGVVIVDMTGTSNNLKVTANPTTGSDTDLCTVIDVSSDAAGTVYSFMTAIGTALQVATNGVDAGMDFTIIVPVGTIDLVTDATDTDGSVEWHIRYRPIAEGATVTLTTP